MNASCLDRPENCRCDHPAHSAAVAAGRSGEDAHGHGRNLEEDVDVDQYQQDQQRKLLHHVAGIGEVDQLRVILREQVCQDAQDGRGEHLIEAEPNECPEPSPEQKLQLVKDKKRDEYGTEEANDCAGDCSICDDGADHGGEGGNQDLNNDVWFSSGETPEGMLEEVT